MSGQLEAVIQSGLALTPGERVIVIDAIQESLQHLDPAIEAAWLDEVKRRWAEYQPGTVRLITEEEFLAESEDL